MSTTEGRERILAAVQGLQEALEELADEHLVYMNVLAVVTEVAEDGEEADQVAWYAGDDGVTSPRERLRVLQNALSRAQLDLVDLDRGL